MLNVMTLRVMLPGEILARVNVTITFCPSKYKTVLWSKQIQKDIFVINMGQSGLIKANSTLNKTIKMCYDAKVYNYTLLAKAIGVSQE